MPQPGAFHLHVHLHARPEMSRVLASQRNAASLPPRLQLNWLERDDHRMEFSSSYTSATTGPPFPIPLARASKRSSSRNSSKGACTEKSSTALPQRSSIQRVRRQVKVLCRGAPSRPVDQRVARPFTAMHPRTREVRHPTSSALAASCSSASPDGRAGTAAGHATHAMPWGSGWGGRMRCATGSLAPLSNAAGQRTAQCQDLFGAQFAACRKVAIDHKPGADLGHITA
jgi:hypothetical protein